MSKPMGSVVNLRKHITKDERKKREAAEDRIKQLPTDKLEPPTWLKAGGKKVFNYFVDELAEMNMLSNVDLISLGILSDLVHRYILVTRQLKDKDLVVEYTNKFGAVNQVENTLVRMQIKYAEQIKKYSADFGLNPSSRLKLMNLQLTDGDDDEFEKDFN